MKTNVLTRLLLISASVALAAGCTSRYAGGPQSPPVYVQYGALTSDPTHVPQVGDVPPPREVPPAEPPPPPVTATPSVSLPPATATPAPIESSAPGLQVVVETLGTPAEEGDRAIAEAIERALNAEPQLAAALPDVIVTVHEGRVTLRGTASADIDRQDLANRIEKIPGVALLENQLQLRPGI